MSHHRDSRTGKYIKGVMGSTKSGLIGTAFAYETLAMVISSICLFACIMYVSDNKEKYNEFLLS